MHRIDTEGSNGTFSDGNPQIGQAGTLIDAAWYQDIQENVAKAIEYAGIALAKGDFTQLTNAIIAIATGVAGGGAGAGNVPTTRVVNVGGLASGGGTLDQDITISVPVASAADAIAGLRNDAALTPLAVAGMFSNVAGASGYSRLPGGVIFQWGGIAAYSQEGQFAVNFPLVFPTACDRVVLTGINGTANNDRDVWPQLVSKTPAGFTGYYQYDGNGNNSIDGCDFFAIGR